MMRHLLILVMMVGFGLTSFSASAQKKSFRNIHFSQHDFVDTVKIKIWDGAVIIPVEINGEVRNLMFDADAEYGFWIGNEEEWMTPSGVSLTMIDSQKSRMKKALTRFPPIKMGNLVIENYPMVVDNSLSNYVCDRIDGAFGFDLSVCGLSFMFDTKDSLMIVTDRKGFFSKEERRQPTLKYKRYHKTRPLVWWTAGFWGYTLQMDENNRIFAKIFSS